jgi:hypothetical protein
MATEIYKIKTLKLLDGQEFEVSPIKIKYLRQLMNEFESVKSANGDFEAISALSNCARICMKQYRPDIAVSVDVFEEHVDLNTIYQILDISAGIKINDKSEETVKSQAVESGSTWESLDLAKLESEVFLLGIWKDYDELEKSLSMPELMATLSISRDLNYEEKKFLAAIQGVDLDKNSNKKNAWEELKARVYSKGQASDANDIVALQGQNAKNAGFGIGLGLDYEKLP